MPIAVCSNGVHTDFVLPVKSAEVDWSAIFLPQHYPVDVTRFDHIGIGWGDLDIYKSTPSWADFDAGIALLALGGAARGPACAVSAWAWGERRLPRLEISPVQYRDLANYIFRHPCLHGSAGHARLWRDGISSIRPGAGLACSRAAMSGWAMVCGNPASPPGSGRPFHSRC